MSRCRDPWAEARRNDGLEAKTTTPSFQMWNEGVVSSNPVVSLRSDARRPVDARRVRALEKERVVRLFLRDREVHVGPEVGAGLRAVRRLVRADREHGVGAPPVLPDQASHVA